MHQWFVREVFIGCSALYFLERMSININKVKINFGHLINNDRNSTGISFLDFQSQSDALDIAGADICCLHVDNKDKGTRKIMNTCHENGNDSYEMLS